MTARELNSLVMHAIASSSLCSAYPRVCRSEGPDGFMPPCVRTCPCTFSLCVHVCVSHYMYVCTFVSICLCVLKVEKSQTKLLAMSDERKRSKKKGG